MGGDFGIRAFWGEGGSSLSPNRLKAVHVQLCEERRIPPLLRRIAQNCSHAGSN